ncbi:hypothetical protein BDY19DRAFT_905671 [Irpex rosettiformis]|uniref:Uncharacterized protein n=1 Tax=Irpex rosettiformis TaxID=378272 RepID=A0ACB8U6U2_9APHY|nr:hypothetical protein BDY19DRAFT_905671 [Irpex rosettiformis]
MGIWPFAGKPTPFVHKYIFLVRQLTPFSRWHGVPIQENHSPRWDWLSDGTAYHGRFALSKLKATSPGSRVSWKLCPQPQKAHTFVALDLVERGSHGVHDMATEATLLCENGILLSNHWFPMLHITHVRASTQVVSQFTLKKPSVLTYQVFSREPSG